MGYLRRWIPILDKCFCLCGVKSGTIIIGWLEEILNVVCLLLLGMYVIQFERHMKPSLELSFLQDLEDERIFLILIVSTTLLCAVMNGFLLYGAHNEITGTVRLYVILRSFILLSGFIAILFVGIYVSQNSVVKGVIFFVISLLILALEMYFWLIIYSYYRLLEESNGSHISYVDL